MPGISLKDVLKAQKLFDKEIVFHTPLEYNLSLSKRYNAEIYLKREDIQLVRSYKIRWSFNFINSLSKDERNLWVIAASAWNHAQWVALTCNNLKIKWTIFMPQTTPSQKIRKTKKFWWEYIEIKLVWDSFDEAYKNALKFSNETWWIFVHPFDDEKVIIWQATVWMEIIEDFKDQGIDYLLTPIWWWGLIAWVGSVFKEIMPLTKIIWVEPENAASMNLSVTNWKITSLDKANTIAEWTAVKTVWTKTFEIAKDIVDEFVSIPEWLIATTMLELLDDQWIILEWAGALSVAALEPIKDKIKGKKVVCILSWWNFDFAKLPEIQEISLKYLWLKRYFIVSFPQRPWALKEFLNTLWKWDDIVYFEYMKKTAKERWPALIWIETIDKDHFKNIIKSMEKHNIQFEDITENEMYFNFLV